MTLEETVQYMTSKDHRIRALGELLQLDIRIEKLKHMLTLWDRGSLSFVPKGPKELHEKQLEVMLEYRDVLARRLGYEFGIIE